MFLFFSFDLESSQFTDSIIAPLIYSWSAANTGGETKKKVTTGILIVGQCVGNVGAGLNLYRPPEQN